MTVAHLRARRWHHSAILTGWYRVPGLLAALMCAMSVFGCTRAEPRGSDVFAATLDADPETFDPGMMSGSVEGKVAYQLFEGLLSPASGDGPPEPGGASSWTVSDDGLVWTFQLRPDARWSNGDPVVAEDFRYAWLRILRGDVAAEYISFVRLVRNGRRFEAGEVDEQQVGIRTNGLHELIVELEESVPYFAEILPFYTFFPVHRGSIEAHGQEGAFRPENLVTNGAFRMREYRRRNRVHLERNPNYWGVDSVALREVYLEIIEDLSANVSAFRDGRVDWTDHLPHNQLRTLQAMPEFRTGDMLGVYYFRLNTTAPPLDDVRVRRALSLALNREELCRCTLDALYAPTTGFVPPIPGYTGAASVRFAPDEARELLADAGFPSGDGLPVLQLLFNTSENHRVIAESVQDMWQRELGIRVELVNQEWKVYLDSMRELDYQVARSAWIGDYADPNTFLEIWRTGDENNRTGWSDPTFDQLVNQAMAQAPQERLVTLRRAEEILLEQMPVVPVYTYAQFHLVSERVRGWELNARDVHLLRRIRLEGP